jgi:uncharacterized integral membrane protein
VVAIAPALAIFAYRNDEIITLRYFRRGITLPISLLISAVHLLGILSGWTVVGFLRRSWRRAIERPQR